METLCFPLPKIISDFIFSIISSLIFKIKKKYGHHCFAQDFPLGNNIANPILKSSQWGCSLKKQKLTTVMHGSLATNNLQDTSPRKKLKWETMIKTVLCMRLLGLQLDKSPTAQGAERHFLCKGCSVWEGVQATVTVRKLGLQQNLQSHFQNIIKALLCTESEWWQVPGTEFFC